MQQRFKILIVLALLVTWMGCQEEAGPLAFQPDFGIEAFKVPERFNISRPREYALAFRVTHPQGREAVEAVFLQFFGSDGATLILELPLYDDGGVQVPGSRDVVAKDGIFTNALVPQAGQFPVGEVFLQAEAIARDQQSAQTESISLLVLENIPPLLQSLDAPDTLRSGSVAVTFSATVQDSNDVGDVDAVMVRLKRGGGELASDRLTLQESLSSDRGVFQASFDSSYAAERQGDYTLEFQALDLGGETSNILSKSIYLENRPPNLFNLNLAETFQRPAFGTDTLVVRISAGDPQGLGDLDVVSFVVQREGGTPSTIEMFDDGDLPAHRDEQAGDGVYSRGLLVESASTPGVFRFAFTAVDRVGNPSETVVDSLEILP